MTATNTTRAVANARQRMVSAEVGFTNAILEAVLNGIPVREVADAAGLTPQRIYQIRDAHRELSHPPAKLAP
jgi:hypothetical protein